MPRTRTPEILRTKIYGTDGDDTLVGTDGADFLAGKYGNDVLIGGAGDDILRGDQDSDTLIGGTGNDILYMDRGKENLAVFHEGDGHDKIMDFRKGHMPYALGDDIELVGVDPASVTILSRVDADGNRRANDTIIYYGDGDRIDLIGFTGPLTVGDLIFS